MGQLLSSGPWRESQGLAPWTQPPAFLDRDPSAPRHATPPCVICPKQPCCAQNVQSAPVPAPPDGLIPHSTGLSSAPNSWEHMPALHHPHRPVFPSQTLSFKQQLPCEAGRLGSTETVGSPWWQVDLWPEWPGPTLPATKMGEHAPSPLPPHPQSARTGPPPLPK